MKRRQFTLLILLMLGVALWSTLAWWLPPILAQIPALEKRADLIQTIDSIFSIVALVVNLGMGYLLWLTHQQQEERRTDELAPLRATTWQTIRERSPQGARVLWIDRGATDANEWRAQPRLALIGLSGEGKSREAAELIRRAVELDLVAATKVFEPNRDFLYAGAALTTAALDKVVEPTQRACLFIDDLHSYSMTTLEQLATLLALFTHPQVDHRYVVATVRSDLISAEQQEWLQQQGFHLVRLPKIDAKQAEQWLTSAGQIHSLTLSKKVRQTFIQQNQPGTPGHLLRGLLTIKSTLSDNNKGQAQIKPAQVTAVMSDLTTQERQALYRRQPLAAYLLTALAHFHAAEVRTAQPLILAYAALQYRREHHLFSRWQAWQRGQTLRRTLTYLLNFDVNVENGLIVTPDALLESVTAGDARRVSDFLVAYRRLFHNRLLRRFHRHAEAQRWALFDLALQHQKQQAYALSERLYTVAINVSPHHWCYNNRGLTRQNQGDLPAAIADYNQSISLNPQLAAAYNNRGNARKEQGDLPAAIADFGQAIALDPHEATAYNNRGIARQDQGQVDNAITDYNQAIALNSQFAAAYNNRGNAHKAQGDLPAAIADYDQAIAFNPRYTDAYFNRGTTHYNQGDLPAAIANFDQAIALNPQYAAAYNNRGLARYDQGDLAAAIADYNQAIALNPQFPMAYYNRGLVRTALGQVDEAIADYDQVITLLPDGEVKTSAYNNRGLAHYDQGDLADALADFDQATALNPQFATAYNNRGLARQTQGDLSAAIADYDQAIALNPQFANAYNNRGNARYDQGQIDEAIADYRKALERAEVLLDQGLRVYRSLGTLLREQAKWQEALATYRQALTLDDSRLSDWLALADVARRAGDEQTWQEALAQVRRQLSADDAYHRACLESVAGNVEEALAALTQAAQADDFDPTRTRQDPDLAWVQTDSRFAAIVGKEIEMNVAAQPEVERQETN